MTLAPHNAPESLLRKAYSQHYRKLYDCGRINVKVTPAPDAASGCLLRKAYSQYYRKLYTCDPITRLVGRARFNNFGLTSEEATEHFRQWKPRATDVAVTTFPKTGTTVVQQICEVLRCDQAGLTVEETMDFEGIEQVQPALAYAYDVGQDLNHNQRVKGARVFKNHAPLSRCPGRFAATDCKYIVTVRDPAATLVSWFNFQQKKGENDETKFFLGEGDERCQSADEMLAFSGMPIINGNDIWDTFLEFYRCRHLPNVLLLAYEDLCEAPHLCIERIAAFMGIPCDSARVARVRERSTKHFMGELHASKFDETWLLKAQMRHATTPVMVNPAARITTGACSKDLSAESREILARQWQSKITKATELETYQDMLLQLRREACEGTRRG